MLNLYYWYSIITSVIVLLYLIPVSSLNTEMDILLLVLIMLSVIVSTFLGKLFKKKFEYKDCSIPEKRESYKPVIAIILVSILEFVYAHDIPLISVTVKQINTYQEFETIPFLHVFLSMIALYYSTKYIYHAVSYNSDRNKNILAYIIINAFMLLFNMRSFLMISLFVALNLAIAKIRKYKKIKFKHYFRVTILVVVLLFLFGCYGNMRQGYKWNDSSYIERLGYYTNWPDGIPKQYMWGYSYITSPIANLNYNVKNNFYKFNVEGVLYQILPQSISKRLPGYNKMTICKLKKSYFNVSTGFCSSFANGNYFGLIFFWLLIMLIPIGFIKYSNVVEKKEIYIIWLSIYTCILSFMFFTNMFSYGGTSPALWLSSYLLMRKHRFVYKKENEK